VSKLSIHIFSSNVGSTRHARDLDVLDRGLQLRINTLSDDSSFTFRFHLIVIYCTHDLLLWPSTLTLTLVAKLLSG